MESPWRRLRERRIFQWTAAYLAGAWLLVQVAHLLGEQFGLPLSFLRGLTAVLATGVLAVLVLAWYHGEAGRQRVSGPELVMLAAIMTMAAASVALVRGGADPGSPMVARADAGLELATLPSRERSIAVLPFANMSDDRDNEHFSDGLTEELLMDLARTTNLRVISRTSVMRFKGGELGVRQIGDELGVAYVVSGGVRRSAERVRITVQLIDARTDQHVWAERYDSDWTDIFAIQREMSTRISAALRAALPAGSEGDAESGQLVSRRTDNAEAYQLYLEGRYLFHNRFGDDGTERLNRSVELLRRAVEMDPSFAQAWGALALACASFSGQPGALLTQAEGAARAHEASMQAIAVDPRLADPYVARGMVYARQLRWAEAERNFLQALSAEPQNAYAHDWYGTLLVTVGRSAEAERVLRRSAELDPINASTLHWLADALRNMGQLDESRVHAQRSVDLGLFGSTIGVYIYHVQRREWDAAVAYMEAAFRTRGYPYSHIRPVVAAIDDPRRVAAADAAVRAARDSSSGMRTLYPAFYFDLDAPDLVFAAVDSLIGEGLGLYAFWRFWEPQLSRLRNHPRMKDVAQRAGLVAYWREFGWPDLCRAERDSFTCS